MHVTCPSCAETFPIAAGFIDGDGKRVAALLAGMEPVLGRAVVGYLRLFKPAKQGLRPARAVKLTAELVELVRAGSVCRDERGGARRPASPAMWAAGIEQMLADTAKLVLPIAGHNYLRAIVYGLADKAAAEAERSAEADRRAGRHLTAPSVGAATRSVAMNNELRAVDNDLFLKLITSGIADQRRAEIRGRYAKEA